MKRRFAVLGLIAGLLAQPLSAFALDTTFDIKLSPPTAAQGTAIGGQNAIGDINGDGIDDVIVGDPSMSPSAVYIYYGAAAGPSTVSKTLEEEEASTAFGVSVAAGDVNNDGYDDVIVGARTYSSTVGRVYVFFGSSDMNTVADVTMTGEAASDSFGRSVATGDINNDGYDDVVVGADGYSSSTGRTYVFFGGSSMNNTADVTLTGEGTSGSFGYSVATGDVNNDSYDDVIVGAPNYDTDGRAYVFLGGSSMDTTIDVTMDENSGAALYAQRVVSGVDVNNDGYDDVIVAEKRYNGSTGRVLIYLGGSTMNNGVDVTLNGEGSSDFFGEYIAGAGDVNADGYDDVIVSSIAYPAETYDGRVYLFYGGSSMNNVADLEFNAPSAGSALGGSPLTGDVNDDATVDIMLGAGFVDDGDGAVYAYLGTDVTKPTIATLSPADGATDVSTTGSLIITFNEIVQGGTGTVVIKKSSDDSIVETITTNGGLMAGSGSRIITIDPATNLDASTGYYVTIHANAFRDRRANYFAGISSTTTWNFTTAAAASSSSSSSSNSSSSSSSSQTAVERQGSGGGRGAGSTTRNSDIVQSLVRDRFFKNESQFSPATEKPAFHTPEEKREQRILQRKERMKRLLDRRAIRRQQRLNRLGNR